MDTFVSETWYPTDNHPIEAHREKKIRKPLLVMGVVVVVAMVNLLFPFGDTMHLAHAASNDTQPPTYIGYALSVIEEQQAQIAQSLQMLNGLGNDYYTQEAASDYDTAIEPNVNNWLDSLVNEAQNDGSLNYLNYDPYKDQSTIMNAMSESYKLNAWASSVASGSGVPLEGFEITPDMENMVQGALQVFTQILSDSTGSCLQNLRNEEAWYPSGVTLQDVLTQQPWPQPQPECHLVP